MDKPMPLQGLSVRVASLDPAADATRTVAECRELLAALAEQRDGPDRQVMEALVHATAAEALRELGDLQGALDHALSARSRADDCDDVEAHARSLLAIAHVEAQAGHRHQARRHLAEIDALDGVSSRDRVRARMNIASVLRAEGRLDEAAAAFDALQPSTDELDPELLALVQINAASCYQQLGRLDDARRAPHMVRARLSARARPDLWAWLDTIDAWTLARGDDASAATELALGVLDRDRAGTNLAVRGSAVRALAAAALVDGSSEALALARARHEEILPIAEAERARPEVVHLHHSLASLCERQGDLCAAVRHLRDARQVEQALHQDNERVRLEQEALRLELLRMQVQADALRAHHDALAQANRALLASDNARVRMLRTLAHDLRSPLTRILAVADMVDPRSPEAVRQGMDDLAHGPRLSQPARRQPAVQRAEVQPSRRPCRRAPDLASRPGRPAGPRPGSGLPRHRPFRGPPVWKAAREPGDWRGAELGSGAPHRVPTPGRAGRLPVAGQPRRGRRHGAGHAAPELTGTPTVRWRTA